jgi:branched-chain amino acid transport system permease protein
MMEQGNPGIERRGQEFLVSRAAFGSRQILLGVALIAIGFSVPWWAEPSTTHLLIEIFALIAVAQMWNMLSSFGGVVSIGQQAFVGIGAYGFFYVANLGTGNPFLFLPIAGVCAGLVALVFTPLLFRLGGAHFSIATWAFAEMVRIGINGSDVLGAGAGMSFERITELDRWMRGAATYWLAFAVFCIAVMTLVFLLRSPYGVALRAIKTSEGAAESLGISVGFIKRTIFVLSAVVTGLAGGVAYLNALQVSPNAAFSVNWVAFAIFAVIIGGAGTVEGPVIGVLVFFGLRELLSDYGTWYLIILGLASIVVTLFIPEGIFGWVKKKTGFRIFDLSFRVKDRL